MIRLLTALAVALALSGAAAFAQAPGGSGFGPETNFGTCSGCGKEVTWTGGSANAPKRCPHCRVRIGSVDNEDGTETNLNTGRTRTKTPTWVKVLIGVVVVVVMAVGGVIKVMKEERATRTGTRSKMRKAVKDQRRDFGDESAPRRRAAAPPAGDDKPLKMADDDGGFEVIGDAPAPPTPTPPALPEPRRAKAKLLPPE